MVFCGNLYPARDLLFMPSSLQRRKLFESGISLTRHRGAKKNTCCRSKCEPIFWNAWKSIPNRLKRSECSMCICVFDERDYHNGIRLLDLKLAIEIRLFQPRRRSIVSIFCIKQSGLLWKHFVFVPFSGILKFGNILAGYFYFLTNIDFNRHRQNLW